MGSLPGHKQKWGSLFDYFVGACEQRSRQDKIKRLRGLEINHQPVCSRRLDRKIGGLLALQNAINVAGGTPVLVDEISPIRDQTTGDDGSAVGIDRRQFVANSQHRDQVAMDSCQG